MIKKPAALLVAGAVAVWGLTVPAGAQDPPEVPEKPNIEDPAGDANYLGGDQETAPATLSVSDILRVWFTNDAENISVHVQTTAPPPSSNASYIYRIRFNPGEDETGCLWFEIITEGPTFVGEMFGRLRFVCSDADPVEGEVEITEASDTTGITTLTLPRATDPAFDDGAVLAAPNAQVNNNNGADGVGRVTAPVVDDTEVGTDYKIAAPKGAKAKPKKKVSPRAKCKKMKNKKKRKACLKRLKKSKIKKKREKVDKIERTVEFEYVCPCPGFLQLGSLTGGNPNLGGGPIETSAEELYLTGVAEDSSGTAISVEITQDVDGEGNTQDPVGEFCGETDEPIEINRGPEKDELRIFIGDPLVCPGSVALGGTVTFTLSNLP